MRFRSGLGQGRGWGGRSTFNCFFIFFLTFHILSLFLKVPSAAVELLRLMLDVRTLKRAAVVPTDILKWPSFSRVYVVAPY